LILISGCAVSNAEHLRLVAGTLRITSEKHTSGVMYQELVPIDHCVLQQVGN
jgi:hypothetical protein